jgi:hypothetical protein
VINWTTQPPTSVTNNEGTQRTLTVAAAGSYYDVPDATEIYQWQTQAPGSSTWTDVSGANSATFTSPFLVPADNGRKYRCVAFIPGKSQASAETTVTVTPDSTAPVVSQVFGTETLNQIVVRYSERVTAATAGITGAYGVTGGLVINAVALQANGTDVILTTTPQTPGTQYTVQVTGVRDVSVAGNLIAPNPTTKQFTAWQLVSGWVKRSSWFSNAGGGAGTITNNPSRYASPELVDYMRTFETVDSPSTDRANGGFGREIENWSWQLDGYLQVPTSGDYTFAVSADDNSSVWLSTDSSPANLRLICAEPEWNGFRDFNGGDRRNGGGSTFPGRTRVNWTRYPQLTGSEGSLGTNIPLVAGVKYYMRAFTFDGCCGDHVSVALTASGLPAIDNNANAIIPQSWMYQYATPDNTVTFTQQPPAGRTVIDGQQTTLTIAATPSMIGLYPSGSSPDGAVQTWAKYQWQYSDDGGTTWTDVPSGLAGQSGRQTASYTTTYLTLTQQGRQYRCAVEVPGKVSYSSVSTMTIVPPSLQITKVGADAIVSWPAVPSYVLQSTNALPGGATGWTDETNNIGLQGTVPMGTYLLTNPAPTGNKFFELKKP